MGNACSGYAFLADEEFHVPQTGFRIPVRTAKKMGWKPDLPDFRDMIVDLPGHKKANFPQKIDLRPEEHFGIYDQGNLGSCTANAIGACFHFDQVKEGLKEFVPSRLFIYYNERRMEGTVEQDAGALIRDGIKSLKQIGCCEESIWPYEESCFTLHPPDSCYESAAKNRATSYARVPQSIEDMKAVLCEGFPFAFGFVVLSSFMHVDHSGMMKMPMNTDKVMGGHAVCCVGYDDAKKCMIVRNSWSERWGDKGYFYMPYAYISHPQLARDFWYVESITGKNLPAKNMYTH